jgi:hypothetical protein
MSGLRISLGCCPASMPPPLLVSSPLAQRCHLLLSRANWPLPVPSNQAAWHLCRGSLTASGSWSAGCHLHLCKTRQSRASPGSGLLGAIQGHQAWTEVICPRGQGPPGDGFRGSFKAAQRLPPCCGCRASQKRPPPQATSGPASSFFFSQAVASTWWGPMWRPAQRPEMSRFRFRQ